MSAFLSLALALATSGQTAPPAAAAAPAPAPVPAVYSTASTSVGTLIADPAAKAILEKHLPGISSNPQLQAVIDMPLKSIQPFAPDKLTDAKLAAIDAELALLPKK